MKIIFHFELEKSNFDVNIIFLDVMNFVLSTFLHPQVSVQISFDKNLKMKFEQKPENAEKLPKQNSQVPKK